MQDIRFVKGRKAASLGIWGNLFLAILKITAGIISNSTAVIADGIHSFSDIVTSIVVWMGMRVSQKPPDAEHPYGHEDVEPIVGLIVSLFLVLVGFEFARHSLLEFHSRVVIPDMLAVYVTIAALLGKEAMTRYVLGIAKSINSPALKADAYHHRSDVYSSIVVLFGVLGARAGYAILDPLAGVVVSLIVMKIGIDVGTENIRQLMGTVPSPELKEEIERSALAIEKVEDVHGIRIHGIGAFSTVDLHICVDERLSLSEAHAIAHEVQENILANFPEIISALVHLEPYDKCDAKEAKKPFYKTDA